VVSRWCGTLETQAGDAAEQCRNSPTYLVRLRPEPGVDPVRALRATLKTALRRFGLKVIEVREEA
jgi:hypothetical protein